jgi:hypothetical protein
LAARGIPRSEPEILEMTPQKMAVVYSRGKPDQVFPRVLPALYGCIQALKFDLKKSGRPGFEVGGLRARYPDAHLVPLDQWTNVVGLPVPEDTGSLPQKVGGAEIRLETWEYGTVAQITHLGSYGDEHESVERLLRFINQSGYRIIGVHEEEYLNLPDTAPRTTIRYRVGKK